MRLEAVLRGLDGALVGSLVRFHGAGEARFTSRDEPPLGSVLPAIAAALQMHGTARADEGHVPGPDRPATLLFTLAGEKVLRAPFW